MEGRLTHVKIPSGVGANLLWVDCIAAAIAGLAVLAFRGWLSALYALPQGLLLLIGTVNLVYASYSFSLSVRAKRPLHLIKLLVFANLTWAGVCIGLAAAYSGSAALFGLGHLVGEAAFVSGLAALEWTWRETLRVRRSDWRVGPVRAL